MSNTNAFEKAVRLLPERLRKPLLFLPTEMQEAVEELRLRCGGTASLTVNGGALESEEIVTAEDIRETLDRASQYSFHTVRESMKQGFLSAQGGMRIGLGGTVIMQDGEVRGFRTVSSLCIRIPHCVECVTDRMFGCLRDRDVLICSPPGAGKTTFLRELIRRISESGKRVSLVDERGELAAMLDGIPQLDVGRNTDVLEFCPKAEAAELMLRVMNPQVLAMDELTQRELGILEKLRASGVQVIASAHAESRKDLTVKGIDPAAFDYLVQIRLENGMRSYSLEEAAVC